mgnify:CR=1
MAAQLEVEIVLAPSDRGGLTHAITGGEWRTVLGIGGEHWSARLLFQHEITPGEKCHAQVEFLFPEATEHFPAGAEFTVWHGGVVGGGRVITVAA